MNILTFSEWQNRTYTNNITNQERVSKAIDAATRNLNGQCAGAIFALYQKKYWGDFSSEQVVQTPDQETKYDYLLTAITLATDYYIESGGLYVNINTNVNSTAGSQNVNGNSDNAKIVGLRQDIRANLTLAGCYQNIKTYNQAPKTTSDLSSLKDDLWQLLFSDGTVSSNYGWSSQRTVTAINDITAPYASSISEALNIANQIKQDNIAINEKLNTNTQNIQTNKNNITTLDNDLGDLGDQVGTIQGDVNSLKLVQKQQGKDIIILENQVEKNTEFINSGYIIRFLGDWNADTLYEPNDYVLENNESYFCTKENKGLQPSTNPEYWYKKDITQGIDLTNYYTKQEIDTKLSNYAELNEDNEFIGDNTFSGTNTFNTAVVNTISVNNSLACSGNAQFTKNVNLNGETNFNNNGVVINNDFMNVDVPAVFANSTNFARVPTYNGNPLVYSSQLNAYALKSDVRNVRQFAVAPSSFRYVNGFNNGNTRTKIYTYQISSSIRSTLINITWKRSQGMWLTMNYEIDVNGYIQFYFNRPDTSNDFSIDGVFYIYYY